eukprot:scaffold7976_cov184-Amphora_coffeaeformis.AAC.1
MATRSSFGLSSEPPPTRIKSQSVDCETTLRGTLGRRGMAWVHSLWTREDGPYNRCSSPLVNRWGWV